MKKLKSKCDIPNWFPSKSYAGCMDLEQWHTALLLRLAIKATFENTKDAEKANSQFQEVISETWADAVTEGLFPKSDDSNKSMGVDDTKAFYFGLVAALMLRNKEGKELIESINEALEKYPYYLHLDDTSALESLYELPEEGRFAGEIIKKSRDTSPFEFINPDEIDTYQEPLLKFITTINLDLDDETLKLLFSLWLTMQRQHTGRLKKPFSEKDIKNWIDYKILPAFDLVFWGKINGVTFTDNLIANTLWPDEEIDVVDRYRKVTKPKVDEFFKDFDVQRKIASQIELEKFFSGIIDKIDKSE